MPALYEGSALYMPSALPGISLTQAVSLMQEQEQDYRTSPPPGSHVFCTGGPLGQRDGVCTAGHV